MENARLKCNLIVGELAAGKKASEIRKKPTKRRTFGYVFRWYIKNYAKPNKKTWKVDEMRWEWVKDWDQKPLRDIKRADFIERLNNLIQTKGPNRARHEMSLINSVFNQAKANGWVRRRPGRGVPLPRPNERDRHVTSEEMPRFFTHLKARERYFQDYVTISLFAGARQMNVLAMEWTELSRRFDKWTIPKEKAKEGKAIQIPLLPTVQAVLKRRRTEVSHDCKWVFPSNGTRKSSRGHITTVKREWAKFCTDAKLVSFKPHDMRHTIATWMVDCGISKEIIAKLLGHQDTSSTDIYAKVNVNPVRAALEIGAKAIEQAAVGKKSKKSPK